MTYTCAEAAKLLKKLNEELRALRAKEEKSFRFVAALDENIESARPVYDYEETQEAKRQLEAKIRKVKHAINRFNLETVIPEFDMTVDEMLIFIPQLSEKKRQLTQMASYLPKERVDNGYQATKVIEYTYANYDVAKAAEDLSRITDELAKAQNALDVTNHQSELDLDI